MKWKFSDRIFPPYILETWIRAHYAHTRFFSFSSNLTSRLPLGRPPPPTRDHFHLDTGTCWKGKTFVFSRSPFKKVSLLTVFPLWMLVFPVCLFIFKLPKAACAGSYHSGSLALSAPVCTPSLPNYPHAQPQPTDSHQTVYFPECPKLSTNHNFMEHRYSSHFMSVETEVQVQSAREKGRCCRVPPGQGRPFLKGNAFIFAF